MYKPSNLGMLWLLFEVSEKQNCTQSCRSKPFHVTVTRYWWHCLSICLCLGDTWSTLFRLADQNDQNSMNVEICWDEAWWSTQNISKHNKSFRVISVFQLFIDVENKYFEVGMVGFIHMVLLCLLESPMLAPITIEQYICFHDFSCTVRSCRFLTVVSYPWSSISGRIVVPISMWHQY